MHSNVSVIGHIMGNCYWWTTFITKLIGVSVWGDFLRGMLWRSSYVDVGGGGGKGWTIPTWWVCDAGGQGKKKERKKRNTEYKCVKGVVK